MCEKIKLDVWITRLSLGIFQLCLEVEGAFNILTRASGYFVILMAVLSIGSKLNVSFLMEHELQRLLRDRLFYRAFPLSPSSLSLCLSASLAHQVKAGVYRNSRQAGPCHTAEQHRNVLYALERQDSWGEIVRQVPQTWLWCAETRGIHSPVRRGQQFCVAL